MILLIKNVSCILAKGVFMYCIWIFCVPLFTVRPRNFTDDLAEYFPYMVRDIVRSMGSTHVPGFQKRNEKLLLTLAHRSR